MLKNVIMVLLVILLLAAGGLWTFAGIRSHVGLRGIAVRVAITAAAVFLVLAFFCGQWILLAVVLGILGICYGLRWAAQGNPAPDKNEPAHRRWVVIRGAVIYFGLLIGIVFLSWLIKKLVFTPADQSQGAATETTVEEAEENEEAEEAETGPIAIESDEDAAEAATTSSSVPVEPEEKQANLSPEEQKLTAFAEKIHTLDPEADREVLYKELVRVSKEENDPEYQRVIINHLMAGKTTQTSPYLGQKVCIVRIFRGFTQVNSDGEVILWLEGDRLHFAKGEWNGWSFEAFGIVEYEDNAVRFDTLHSAHIWWVMVSKGEETYLYYWLTPEEAEEDPVFTSYENHMTTALELVVSDAVDTGEVSDEHFKALESLRFQMDLKPISDDVQLQVLEADVQLLLPSEEEIESHAWEYTYVNLELTGDGKLGKINPEKHSLAVRKGPFDIKVTVVR